MTHLPDFDTLKWMAEHNPEGLAKLQDIVNSEAIAVSQCQEQLLCIKHNLDQQLALCTNPYHRCVVAISVMRGKLDTLANVVNHPADFRLTSADIIPFVQKHQ